jgi:hypothetical protein
MLFLINVDRYQRAQRNGKQQSQLLGDTKSYAHLSALSPDSTAVYTNTLVHVAPKQTFLIKTNT